MPRRGLSGIGRQMMSDPEAQLLAALARERLDLAPVWRVNASRLVSISRDGRRLYLNEALRHAPRGVLEAAAGFAAAALAGHRDPSAVEAIRRWSRGAGQRHLAEVARRAWKAQGRARRPSTAVRQCGGTTAQGGLLRALYEAMNRDRFGGLLPGSIPLVWSYRMTSTLGNCRMVRWGGVRRVIDIGMNPSLLLAGNEPQLRDTLVHEMAHAAAWITRGDGGHGAAWKEIAVAAGCDPRSRCRASPRLRRRTGERVDRCPDPAVVLAALR
jgi:hypothetical protein